MNCESAKGYFEREQWIPLGGNKAELVKKVADIVYTYSSEEKIGATSFLYAQHAALPSSEQLTSNGWTSDEFPFVREIDVTEHLKGGCNKDFQTDIRLYQCSHLFDLEIVNSGSSTYTKAKI